MKGRRRKTLNAGEIEEFLSELNSNSSNDVNNENTNPNVNDSNNNNNNIIIIKKCTDKLTDNINNNDNNTMENMIRKFCKIAYNSNNDYININNEYTNDIAKKIHINTNYKLLPSRTVYPEQYTLPASSLESKKNLVLSLSPMITEGEKQRLYDAGECEEYTRCRVEKNKMRNGNYEYYDIDINAIISIPDYESRYYAFIESKKKNNHIIDDDNNMNSNDILTRNENDENINIIDEVKSVINTTQSPKSIEKLQSTSPITPALELSSSIISLATTSLATLATTTLVSSSVLTSIIVDHKKDHNSPVINGKTNQLIENLATELDAILANADDEINKNQNAKDKKKRNKMRRSIISMDYLEDLSIVDDDDNDDKRLLWKSKENIIPNEVNNENNIMDSNELSSLELNVNIDNNVMIYNNEFTHEIVIPSDENDDEDIKDVLEEHKQEKYIEQSVISQSNNDNYTDNDESKKELDENDDVIDPNDVSVKENFDLISTPNDNPNKEIDKNTMNDDDNVVLNIHNTDDINHIDKIETDSSSIKNDLYSSPSVINPETFIEIDSGNIDTNTINSQIVLEKEDQTVELNEVINNNNEYNTIENKAFMRLNIRFEQARWKYQWELVSYYAALEAKNKFYK